MMRTLTATLIAFALLQAGVISIPLRFLTAVFATSADSSLCDSSEWLTFGNFCYRVSDANINWFRAEIDCQKAGGQLISLDEPLDLDTTTSLQFMTGCTDIWTGLVLTEPPVNSGDMQNRMFWEFIDPSKNGPPDDDVWSKATMYSEPCHACGYIAGSTDTCPANGLISDLLIKNSGCATERKRGICRKPKRSGMSPAKLNVLAGIRQPTVETTVATERATTIPQTTAIPTTTTPLPPTTTTTTEPTTTHISTMKHTVKCEAGWLGWYDPVVDSRFDVDSVERANCYRKFDHSIVRAAAEEHCSLLGAHLVSIKNKFEEAIVTYLSQCCPIWIGLEWTNDADLCQNQNAPQSQFEWNWVDIALHPKTTCVEYFNWKDAAASQHENEKLCTILSTGGYWNSELCDNDHQYICKKQGTFIN